MVGEVQNMVVSVRYQQLVDKVFFFNMCGRFIFFVMMLCFVFRKWLIFNVVLVRECYDYIFLGDQIFQVDVCVVGGDFSMMFVIELFMNQFQFFMDYFYQMIGVIKNM